MWLLNCLRGDNGHVAPLNWLMGLFMLKGPAQIRWKTPVPVWAATSRPACVSLSCILLYTRCVCRHGKTTQTEGLWWITVKVDNSAGHVFTHRRRPAVLCSLNISLWMGVQTHRGGVGPSPRKKMAVCAVKYSCNGLKMCWGLPFLETQRSTADLQKSKPGTKTSLWFLQGS